MRIPRTLLVAVTLLSGLGAFAQAAHGSPSSTLPSCATCHAARALTQPLTPMGRALQLPGSNAILKANPRLTTTKNGYTYTVETHGDSSVYSVTDGTRTLAAPIHWGFGAQAQTWVLELDGKFYESLVSYYPTINGLDITTGDEGLKPATLAEALGREQTATDQKVCFNCHATNAVVNGKLNLVSLQPGLGCEHCHAGANAHMVDAARFQFDTAPVKLGKMTSEDVGAFCGQCHRTWEMVVRSRWRGEMNVRFQPYRLANSRCFSGTDPRISCVACHDPHENVARGPTAYDSKCLACHAPALHVASDTTTAKACPVAKSECASCHMPKVALPNGHLVFTDHQIRVVKAGAPYPN